jgi:hypothetical protein
MGKSGTAVAAALLRAGSIQQEDASFMRTLSVGNGDWDPSAVMWHAQEMRAEVCCQPLCCHVTELTPAQDFPFPSDSSS